MLSFILDAVYKVICCGSIAKVTNEFTILND